LLFCANQGRVVFVASPGKPFESLSVRMNQIPRQLSGQIQNVGQTIVQAANRSAAEFRRHWRFSVLESEKSGNFDSGSEQKSGFLRDERMARVEAVLFLAREALTSRKIAQLCNLSDGTEARTVIRRLAKFYDEAGSAFRVEELAGGYQLFTRPMFGPWLRKLWQNQSLVRLSSPAMETLAIVAYRQPVLRAEIEAVRGVQCGELLRQLMERELVRISGRAEDLGRPLLYGTTKRFLQVFGLRHLDELPRAEQLRRTEPAGVNSTAAIATREQTEGLPDSLPETTSTKTPDSVRFHEEELC
jgi:segregation and condensation protein B